MSTSCCPGEPAPARLPGEGREAAQASEPLRATQQAHAGPGPALSSWPGKCSEGGAELGELGVDEVLRGAEGRRQRQGRGAVTERL